MTTPTWLLQVAEIASRVLPPLLRVAGARRAATDAEARKRAIREELEGRALRRDLERRR